MVVWPRVVVFREVSRAQNEAHYAIDFADFARWQREMIVRELIRSHEYDVAKMNANPPTKWASYPHLNRRVRVWNELNRASNLSDGALSYVHDFCQQNCGHHIETCDCDETTPR